MYLQLKKQNDDLIWIGLGFNTKHYQKLGSSVQTDGWIMYLTYQVHVQCVCGYLWKCNRDEMSLGGGNMYVCEV